MKSIHTSSRRRGWMCYDITGFIDEILVDTVEEFPLLPIIIEVHGATGRARACYAEDSPVEYPTLDDLLEAHCIDFEALGEWFVENGDSDETQTIQ